MGIMHIPTFAYDFAIALIHDFPFLIVSFSFTMLQEFLDVCFFSLLLVEFLVECLPALCV